MSSLLSAARRQATAQPAYKCTNCGRDDFKFKGLLSYSAHTRHCFGANSNNDFAKWKKQYDKSFGPTRGDTHKYRDNPVMHLKKRRKVVHDSNPAEGDGDDINHFDNLFEQDIHVWSSSSDSSSESENDGGGDYGGEEEFGGVHKHADTVPKSEAKLPYNSAQAGIPNSANFQVELADLLGRHRSDLTLYDEVIDLVKNHSEGNELDFQSESLMGRKPFLAQLVKNLKAEPLVPTDVEVELTDGSEVTVSVFDIEAMILSLLHDENLMRPENLADGYDLHTGKPTEAVTHYGEIHTGDAWEPARKHYCGDGGQNMPIALVLFVDKSYIDLYGGLSATPVCFTLSCFNLHPLLF